MRQSNKSLSKFNQYILVTVHSVIYHQVDKYSVITQHNQIRYSTKDDPHTKKYINMTEATRIFTDLYGNPKQRWTVSKGMLTHNRKLKAEAKRRNISVSELRKRYINSF